MASYECIRTCYHDGRLFRQGAVYELKGEVPPHFKRFSDAAPAALPRQEAEQALPAFAQPDTSWADAANAANSSDESRVNSDETEKEEEEEVEVEVLVDEDDLEPTKVKRGKKRGKKT